MNLTVWGVVSLIISFVVFTKQDMVNWTGSDSMENVLKNDWEPLLAPEFEKEYYRKLADF